MRFVVLFVFLVGCASTKPPHDLTKRMSHLETKIVKLQAQLEEVEKQNKNHRKLMIEAQEYEHKIVRKTLLELIKLLEKIRLKCDWISKYGGTT